MKRRDCLLGGGVLAMTLAATIADAQIGSSPTTGSDGPARKTKGRRILMFDVNETLLDLAPLKEPFEKAYGRPDALKAWFTDAAPIRQRRNLDRRLPPLRPPWDRRCGNDRQAVRCVSLDPDALKGLVSRIRTLPPHPDVKAGLESLMDAGFRLVTLTNSAPDAAEAQLKHAGLRPLFEKVYTVEPVKVFKPHPATYRSVADDLGGCDLRSQADRGAYGWDIAELRLPAVRVPLSQGPGQELYPSRRAPMSSAGPRGRGRPDRQGRTAIIRAARLWKGAKPSGLAQHRPYKENWRSMVGGPKSVVISNEFWTDRHA